MARYAASTEVSTTQSRDEIERTLKRYGASGFAFAWQGNSAMIEFILNDRRRIRFVLPLPQRDQFSVARYSATDKGRARSAEEASNAWERACRQAWRALLLIVKAKLEAVEAGIVTMDDEFMANVVLPDGQTVSDWIKPQFEAIGRGEMPKLLPDYSR